MVKKLQKLAEKKQAAGAGLLDNQLAQSVKESAQQIWLAGMGAFAKAQEEGGKVFEALVKEGTSLQRRTQAAAEERIGEVASRMTAAAEGVTSKANQQWDKLESIFEERTAKAMARLGVPTKKDFDALVKRVDALAAKAGGAAKPAAKAAARGAVKGAAKSAPAPNGSTRPAAKRAAARKTA